MTCFLFFLSAIPCIKPPQTEVARAQMPNNIKSLHHAGETVDFECQPGYKVVGNAIAECNEGNWTETDFYCESKFVENLSNDFCIGR